MVPADPDLILCTQNILTCVCLSFCPPAIYIIIMMLIIFNFKGNVNEI